MYLRQFIRMHRIFQLVRCVRQCGKFHLVAAEHHTTALAVRHGCPAYTNLVAALLRNEIFRHIVFDFILINAKLCSGAAVHIRLLRSHAVPGNMVIIGIQLEHYAELRHIAELFHRIVGQRRLNAAIAEDAVGQLALACRCGRHHVAVADFRAVLVHFDFRCIQSRIMTSVRIFVGQIHRCNLPLAVTHRHQASAVVVDRRTPEVRLRNHLDHLDTAVTVGYESAVQVGEHHIEVLTAHTKVMVGTNHFKFRRFFCFCRCFHFVNTLSESDFMAAFSPYRILFQTEGNGHCVLARKGLYGNRKFCCFFGKRLHGNFHRHFFQFLSFFFENYHAVKRIGIHKQVFIFYNCFVFLYLNGNILIAKFYFLHLRGRVALAAVYNTISAEIVVARMIVKISAVCLEFFSITVFFVDGLINVIPDKSALEQRLFLGKIHIFLHRTAGISHRMRVFTANIRFSSVLR